MSLVDMPLNEELETFGFPWHGLFVAPNDGAPFIELASGRRIYSDAFGDAAWWRSNGSDTVLVDMGLDLPSVQPSDPEAVLWNRFIASYTEGTRYYSCWGIVRGGTLRVRIDDQFPYLYFEVVTPSTGVRVTAVLGRPPFAQMVTNITTDALQGMPREYSRPRVLDISAGGRRWLLALRRWDVPFDYPYAIRVDADEREGIGAIIEIEFDETFSAMSSRVVAGYIDCVLGRNTSGSDGRALQQDTMWVVLPEGGQDWIEWGGEGEPPTPPYYAPDRWGTSYPALKIAILHGVGSSVATASRDIVAGAWYGADGAVEVVWARIATRDDLNAGRPTRRSDMAQWWSPYTRTYQYSVQVRVGAGPWQQLLSFSSVMTRTPNATDFNYDWNGVTYSFGIANAPVSSPSVYNTVGEILLGLGRAHDSAPRKKMAGLDLGGGDTHQMLWRACWESSNNVISSVMRVDSVKSGVRGCEYVVGPAITPGGIDTAVERTGNVVPGHSTWYPGFDRAIFERHRLFARAAYNPVTGQVARQRLGDTFFTWV